MSIRTSIDLVFNLFPKFHIFRFTCTRGALTWTHDLTNNPEWSVVRIQRSKTTCVREACPLKNKNDLEDQGRGLLWVWASKQELIREAFELHFKSLLYLAACNRMCEQPPSLFQFCTQVSFRTAACFTATLTDYPFFCSFFFCKRHACFAVAGCSWQTHSSEMAVTYSPFSIYSKISPFSPKMTKKKNFQPPF